MMVSHNEVCNNIATERFVQDAASKGMGLTHIHAFISCNLFVVGKENGRAIPPRAASQPSSPH